MVKRGRYSADTRHARRFSPLILSVGIVLVAAVILVVLLVVYRHRSPVPPAIRKQVSFVLYVPSAPWQTANSSYTYNQQAGALSFTATDGTQKLTVFEQAAPSQFADIPDYYPTLLNKLNEYDNIGTANGTAYLTRPTELGGRTEAVLTNQGTLMFIYPAGNLSESQWRNFFNNLQIIK